MSLKYLLIISLLTCWIPAQASTTTIDDWRTELLVDAFYKVMLYDTVVPEITVSLSKAWDSIDHNERFFWVNVTMQTKCVQVTGNLQSKNCADFSALLESIIRPTAETIYKHISRTKYEDSHETYLDKFEDTVANITNCLGITTTKLIPLRIERLEMHGQSDPIMSESILINGVYFPWDIISPPDYPFRLGSHEPYKIPENSVWMITNTIDGTVLRIFRISNTIAYYLINSKGHAVGALASDGRMPYTALAKYVFSGVIDPSDVKAIKK